MPAVIQAGHSTLQDLQIGPQARTSVKHINIQKAVCNFHRLKDGRWQTLNKLPENKTPQTTRDSQPAFRIDSLVIDGQSIINLRDEKISPALNTRIKLNKARVSDINSQAPKRPVKLALSGQLGEYSSFDLTGNLFPFTDKTNLNIQGKIVNLDLPPYSGYAAEHLGYQLSSGHLDSNIETQIKDDVINGNIKLKLNNLDISEDDPQKMKALTEQISIPLDTALAMLRNDNNDIKLDVAVTGNITDPSFDFGDAINQAIGKAVKKTAISYLSYSLGPFGALIALSDLAKGLSKSVNLKAIDYAPGNTTFSLKDKEYLSYVAKLLQDRPQLRIRLCGIATANDRIALSKNSRKKVSDEQLLELARERALKIAEHFIKEYSIAARRLFLCNPVIASDNQSTPQVKLSL